MQCAALVCTARGTSDNTSARVLSRVAAFDVLRGLLQDAISGSDNSAGEFDWGKFFGANILRRRGERNVQSMMLYHHYKPRVWNHLHQEVLLDSSYLFQRYHFVLYINQYHIQI